MCCLPQYINVRFENRVLVCVCLCMIAQFVCAVVKVYIYSSKINSGKSVEKIIANRQSRVIEVLWNMLTLWSFYLDLTSVKLQVVFFSWIPADVNKKWRQCCTKLMNYENTIAAIIIINIIFSLLIQCLLWLTAALLKLSKKRYVYVSDHNHNHNHECYRTLSTSMKIDRQCITMSIIAETNESWEQSINQSLL